MTKSRPLQWTKKITNVRYKIRFRSDSMSDTGLKKANRSTEPWQRFEKYIKTFILRHLIVKKAVYNYFEFWKFKSHEMFMNTFQLSWKVHPSSQNSFKCFYCLPTNIWKSLRLSRDVTLGHRCPLTRWSVCVLNAFVGRGGCIQVGTKMIISR